jgi:hypothetical protein
MKKTIIILILSVFLLLPGHVMAGNPLESIKLKVRAGYSIGGTAPLGIPATIRSVDAYRLTTSFMGGVDAMTQISGNWGAMVGVRFENKGMDTEITTKNYYMEVVKGDSHLAGMYTGSVRQKVTEWMFTVPVMATYQVGKKVQLKAGPYVSLLINKDFSGYVFDGYLRQNNPTGAKIVMGHEANERATYDFSDDMRRFQTGVMVGADWQVCKKLGVSADLSWGLSGIHKSDFKTIEQTLYPIYGTISVFYAIN